jgi:hypothetical protein
LSLLLRITIQPKLDLTKNHLHKNGLWACPSAEDSSKNNGEEDNKQHEGEQADLKYEKVLVPEYLPKEKKLKSNDIEKKELLTL